MENFALGWEECRLSRVCSKVFEGLRGGEECWSWLRMELGNRSQGGNVRERGMGAEIVGVQESMVDVCGTTALAMGAMRFERWPTDIRGNWSFAIKEVEGYLDCRWRWKGEK